MPVIPEAIRRQIVEAADEGEPRGVTARQFRVSTAFIRKLLQQRRDTGSIAPLPRSGGRRPSIRGRSALQLRRLVRERPDATVAQLAAEVGVSTASTCRALRRLGLVVREGRYEQSERGVVRMPVMTPVFKSPLGKLYEADCLDVLPRLPERSVDLAFVDPPFDRGVRYGRRSHDRRGAENYFAWCQGWLKATMPLLKPGGSLLLWHVPKWTMILGAEALRLGYTYRSWIAVDYNTGKTISNSLTARHYSLLWLSVGSPSKFRVIRVPVRRCRRCGETHKDYGGKLHALHEDGLRLSDVWTDISPVHHRKNKNRVQNELPPKLVRRCIEMLTRPGDMVLDPMAGAGTVPVVCEELNREWRAVEIESTAGIVERLRRCRNTRFSMSNIPA